METSLHEAKLGAEQRQCTVCNKPSTLRCSRCSGAWYCGKPCQKEDWSAHKLLCPQYKDFQTAPNGRKNVHRVICFSGTNIEPLVRFLWVTRSELSAHVRPARIHEIADNEIRNRPSKRGLKLWHMNQSFLDAVEPNMGVVAATKGRVTRHWAGPVFVVGGDRPSSQFFDVTIEDLRDVVDYLVSPADPESGSDSNTDKALSVGEETLCEEGSQGGENQLQRRRG